MAFENVDVFVKSSLDTSPVEGVLVRIFDAAGLTVFTEAVTGVDGRVSFLLPTGSYSMRFYKFATSFSMPQSFEVVASVPPQPSPNVFDVVAVQLAPLSSTDPRLCCCSGYFRDLNGDPKKFLDMHFLHKFDPVLLEGSAVIADRVAVRTDEKGFASISLIRGACYIVTIESMECLERVISVPDASSANLPDVLFPVVQTVVLAPFSVPVLGTTIVEPTVLTSAGIPLEGAATSDVLWKIEDDTVASISAYTATGIEIRGLVAGVTQLVATRKDSSIVKIPDLGILGSPIQVTVA